MYGDGKSHSPIIPAKPPNEAEPEAKEVVEERGLGKGHLLGRNMSRTQSRQGMPSALERIRQAILSLWRYNLRQEPDAVMPHVRICGGGYGQP